MQKVANLEDIYQKSMILQVGQFGNIYFGTIIMFAEVAQPGSIWASNAGKGLTIVKKDKKEVAKEPFNFAVLLKMKWL